MGGIVELVSGLLRLETKETSVCVCVCVCVCACVCVVCVCVCVHVCVSVCVVWVCVRVSEYAHVVFSVSKHVHVYVQYVNEA